MFAAAQEVLSSVSWPTVALLAIGAICLWGLHPLQRWRYRKLPGPPYRWLIGHLPEILVQGQPQAFEAWRKQYGPVFVIQLGASFQVVLDDAELAHRVARTQSSRPPFNVSLAVGAEELEFDSYQIVFANGDKWRHTRNAWQPMFSAGSLAGYVPFFNASARRLVGVVGRAADSGEVLDLQPLCGALTLDVVGSTAYGVNFHTLDEPGAGSAAATAGAGTALSELSTPADRVLWGLRQTFATLGVGNPFTGLQFISPKWMDLPIRHLANLVPTTMSTRAKQGRAVLRGVAQELIGEDSASGASSAAAKPLQPHDSSQSLVSAAEHNTGGAGSGATGKGGADATPAAGGNKVVNAADSQARVVVDPGSFLALLKRAHDRKNFNSVWIQSQVFTFIVAGYETTASAIAFTIYLLSAHPDKEAKLLAEIDAFGRDREPTADDLAACFPYMHAVLHESLRLQPPATLALRVNSGEMELAGHVIPDASSIQVSIFGIHRNPRYWPDPEAYIPERFLPGTPENAACDHSAFMPFGDGARKCVGWQFATQEVLQALLALYQRFTFRLTPGQVPLRVKTSLAMSPAEGVKVTVHHRE